MASKANPALIGAFVLGAVALAVVGLVIFGGGQFLRETRQMVLYFDESIKGLAVGAPVTLKGIKVGSVTDIKVVADQKDMTIRTPVFIEIEADRFTDAAGGEIKFRKGAPGAKLLIERGLRAQLELQSFVTGQLAIALDFHPGTPVKLTGLTKDMLEVPTVPSTGEKLAKTVENIPIDQIGKAALRTINRIDRVLRSLELKQTVRALNGTLKEMQKLVQNVNGEVGPLASGLGKTIDTTRETVRDVQKLVRHLDTQTVSLLNETLGDVRTLVRRVDSRVGPTAASLEKTLETARATLERSQRAIVTVDEAIAEESPLRYELSRTLRELSAAARSIRVLTDYLERHPDALVFGKNGSGGR